MKQEQAAGAIRRNLYDIPSVYKDVREMYERALTSTNEDNVVARTATNAGASYVRAASETQNPLKAEHYWQLAALHYAVRLYVTTRADAEQGYMTPDRAEAQYAYIVETLS